MDLPSGVRQRVAEALLRLVTHSFPLASLLPSTGATSTESLLIASSSASPLALTELLRINVTIDGNADGNGDDYVRLPFASTQRSRPHGNESAAADNGDEGGFDTMAVSRQQLLAYALHQGGGNSPSELGGSESTQGITYACIF